MSSDEESRNHLQRVASSKIQVQDFQALILPPVPVARGPNAQHQQQQHQQQHAHSQSQSQSQGQGQTHSPDVSRRPVMSTTRSQHSNSSEPYPKPSNKGGVRGRVTVVCAEVRYSPFLLILSPFIPDACSSFPTSSPVQAPQGRSPVLCFNFDFSRACTSFDVVVTGVFSSLFPGQFPSFPPYDR